MPTPFSFIGFFQRQSQTLSNAETEKWPSLALLPIVGTVIFYVLPDSLQQQRIYQFLPQALAYTGFAVWVWGNTHIPIRLGIQSHQIWNGLRWGGLVGVVLGLCNTVIILYVIPASGMDITFLTQTPHAQVPLLLMVPWFIIAIATFSELNFRGFLLGRLVVLFATTRQAQLIQQQRDTSTPQFLAISTSAFLFAFDPFIVATFQHLHWIAVWDGIIWGWAWVRFRNLYTVIVAHATEVIILYTCIRLVLS